MAITYIFLPEFQRKASKSDIRTVVASLLVWISNQFRKQWATLIFIWSILSLLKTITITLRIL